MVRCHLLRRPMLLWQRFKMVPPLSLLPSNPSKPPLLLLRRLRYSLLSLPSSLKATFTLLLLLNAAHTPPTKLLSLPTALLATPTPPTMAPCTVGPTFCCIGIRDLSFLPLATLALSDPPPPNPLRVLPSKTNLRCRQPRATAMSVLSQDSPTQQTGLANGLHHSRAKLPALSPDMGLLPPPCRATTLPSRLPPLPTETTTPPPLTALTGWACPGSALPSNPPGP